MAEYEALKPGMFERFMTLHEQTEAHKRSLEMMRQKDGFRDRAQGMYIACGCFSLLTISALTAGIMTGSATMVGVFLGAAAVGGIPMFIQGRKDNRPGSQ